MFDFIKKYLYYVIATIILLVVIFFFADVTVFGLISIRRNIKQMHKEQLMYRSQAKADSLFIRRMNDDEFLEKYAREKFYMKRDGEEIYIVEDSDK